MNDNEIFLRPKLNASKKDNNELIHLDLTESVSYNLINLKGGVVQDNLIHLEFSEDTPLKLNLKGGNHTSDSTEYFNRIAKKITSNLSGGNINNKFIGNAMTTKENDDFLSSETINEINMVGGKHTENTFNFSSFKKHLQGDSRAKSNTKSPDEFESSDDDDDDDDELFKDSDDEEDEEEEEDEIIKEINESSENRNKNKLQSHTRRPVASSRREYAGVRQPSDSSESLTLSNDNNNFELSASASTPKLMSYRKVGQGRRFI